MTLKRLAAFDDAWARRDVDSLAEFMTDDSVYSASVGTEPGATYVGKDDVVRGFREVLEYEQSLSGAGESVPARMDAPTNQAWIHGHHAFTQWSFPSVGADGVSQWVRGCDFFEFDARRIRRKDAFVKSVPMKPGERS